MIRLEAHAMLATMQDRGEFDGWPDGIRDQHNAPLFMTALAVVSGALDDATDRESLLEACRHGDSLAASGVVEPDDIEQAQAELFDELERMAKEYGKRSAELN